MRGFFESYCQMILLLLGSNCILEGLARAELGNFGSSDLDLFTCLWVTTGTSFAGRNFEASEADQSYSVALLECISYSGDESADGFLC